MTDATVVYGAQTPLQDLGAGVSRKVLAYSEEMMIVEVHFQADSVGSEHTHPHLQSTYVKSGRFRFTLGGKDVEVGPGDSLSIPREMPHGTLCLEEGVLLDIFTPMRKDFIR